MVEYIPYFDIAAICINIIVTVHYLGCNGIKTRLSGQFNLFLLMTNLSAVTDLITVYTIAAYSAIPVWANYLINEIYLASFNSCTIIYYGYIVTATKDKDYVITTRDRILKILPFIFLFALVFSTGFNHWIIYFDETGYHHGSLFLLLYIISYGYIIGSLIRVIRYRKVLTRFQRFIVYFYIMLCLITIFMQQMFMEYLITEFSLSMTLLLTYFSLENPMDFVDKRTDCFNKKAFFETLMRKNSRRKHYFVLGGSIEGMKYITKVLGEDGADNIKKEVAALILKYTKRKNIFMNEERFCVLEYKKSKILEIADALTVRFKEPFTTGQMDITLSCPMSLVSVPENASVTTEIAGMMYFALDKAVAENAETIIEADSSIVEEMKREPELAQILKQSITTGGFEVYYQPILNVKTGRFETAEALIRLKDEKLKKTSPEEFIPVAEKNGLIIAIGEYVLREVCRFIKEEKLQDLGIKCIDVNLSPLQCLQENLSSRFLCILEEYGVPREMINLEVTETATINSSTVLKSTMDSFIEGGIDFSLDDFGSGYANLTMMVDYPFSNIKLDKYMVWKAFENESSMKVLKSIVNMVHEIGRKIIVEGVETKEQAEVLTAMGCDYFQGYFYSKPVTEQSLLKFLAR